MRVNRKGRGLMIAAGQDSQLRKAGNAHIRDKQRMKPEAPNVSALPGHWYRLRRGEYDVRVIPRNGSVVIVMDRGAPIQIGGSFRGTSRAFRLSSNATSFCCCSINAAISVFGLRPEDLTRDDGVQMILIIFASRS